MSMIYLKLLCVVIQIIRARSSCIKCRTIRPICVDFRAGGKPEYPEKNTRNTSETNYEKLNSHETLGFFSDKRHNALTTCATRATLQCKISH